VYKAVEVSRPEALGSSSGVTVLARRPRCPFLNKGQTSSVSGPTSGHTAGLEAVRRRSGWGRRWGTGGGLRRQPGATPSDPTASTVRRGILRLGPEPRASLRATLGRSRRSADLPADPRRTRPAVEPRPRPVTSSEPYPPSPQSSPVLCIEPSAPRCPEAAPTHYLPGGDSGLARLTSGAPDVCRSCAPGRPVSGPRKPPRRGRMGR